MVELKHVNITAQVSEEHSEMIVALAKALEANANAIKAVAEKARVEIGTAIKIVNGDEYE